VVIEYTEYVWWLVEWRKDKIACRIAVPHEGQPTLDEVYTECEEEVADTWAVQAPCPQETLKQNPAQCEGYYIFLAGTHTRKKEIPVVLPPPEVKLSLENCVYLTEANTAFCEDRPKLVLTGFEPLPNEQIVAIEGSLNGKAFSCGPDCKLDLPDTSKNGHPRRILGLFQLRRQQSGFHCPGARLAFRLP
jgi:hypothetical protein